MHAKNINTGSLIKKILPGGRLLKVIKIIKGSRRVKIKGVCSLDNFNRLISGNVSNTLEKQGIADAPDIPRGRANGNRSQNPCVSIPNNFAKALKLLNSILVIKPDDAEAWNNKGITLNKLGRFEEVLAAYDKAIDIKPDYTEAWYNKGITLYKLGRFEEALAAYDKAIDIKPDHAGAWNNKGVALDKLGRPEEALAAYDKAIDIKPDYAEAWTNKGAAFSDLGRPEEALVAYDKALDIMPDDEHTLRLKKLLLKKSKLKKARPKQALNSFKKLFIKP